jgi:ankyrin repeat protein
MSKILEACRRGNKSDEVTIEKCAGLKQNLNITNSDGQTGLMFASQNGKTNMVRLLLAHKVDLNKVDKGGNCALVYAIIKGFDVIVTILINANANLNIANKKGITPLMYAIREHQFPIAIQLINHGVEIERICSDGFTPLILASKSFDNQHLIQTLLSCGKNALVNHQCNNGNTALHYAIGDGYKNTNYVKLLECGANPHLKNETGESVLDILDKIDGNGFHAAKLLANTDNKSSIRDIVLRFALNPSFADYFRPSDWPGIE